MDANRWEVIDAAGSTHIVTVHKGMLGTPSLRVDGRQVMNLGGEGIVAFEVAGRQARLSPQPGGAGYDFAVGSVARTVIAPAEPDTAAAAAARPTPAVDLRVVRLAQQRARGANWFLWIGALSIINTVLLLVGSSVGFASGLGITEYLAGFVYVIAGESMLWLALVLDVPVVGAIFWLGMRARRGSAWPFVVGGLFYAFDLLLVVTLEDWVGAIIHVLALFAFFTGWRAARALRAMAPVAV